MICFESLVQRLRRKSWQTCGVNLSCVPLAAFHRCTASQLLLSGLFETLGSVSLHSLFAFLYGVCDDVVQIAADQHCRYDKKLLVLLNIFGILSCGVSSKRILKQHKLLQTS